MGEGNPGVVLRLCALLLAWLLVATASAETLKTLAPSKPAPGGERRIALVIGNSAYKEAPLRNPANDARAISQALSETGFAVTMIENATQVTMRRAMRAFGNDLSKATVGLFYFAGHGMQVKGANYLIPVNADIEHEDEVQDQAVDANLVLSKMDSARNAVNIMILDACRNNPFARSFRSAAKGLAQMDAPSGTLISFATAPGSVASDGAGQNGLYTEHFLKAMHAPGMPIEQVFKQVRIGVTRATRDQQIPWESSSLKGDFSFVPGLALASAAPGSLASQEAMQRAVQEATRSAEERSARALQEATRSADERVARERELMQKRMEQMVADMLAKQQAMLDAERAAKGAPPAPATAARPNPPVAVSAPAAPVQVASTAPTPVAAGMPAGPLAAMGDRWRYVGVDAYHSSKKYDALVEVLGATAAGVIESTRDESGPAREWVYTNTPTLVGGSGAMVVFSPLVGPAPSLKVGQTWRGIALERVGPCVGRAGCSAEARVEAFEKVNTAAGSFDAYRIEVAIFSSVGSVQSGGAYGTTRGSIQFWYSPQVKRIVKYTARSRGSAVLFTDMDSELVGYQLAGNSAVGTLAQK